LIEGKKELRASLSASTPAPKKQASNAKPSKIPALQNGSAVGGVFDAVPEAASALAPPFANGSNIVVTPSQFPKQEPVRPEPPPNLHIPPAKPTFFKGAVQRLGALFQRKVSVSDNNPTIKEADQQSPRLVRLEVGAPALLAEATQDLNKETARLTRALKTTNIDTKKLLSRTSQAHAEGGPFIPIEAADMAHDPFAAAITQATAAPHNLH